ncbi:nucleotidyl transferase AbiEii/AbiGii toxin family protein, partial [Micromonospora echinofusca]
FYREVARVALTVADRHGFVLGGGVAWLVNGLVRRPTEDVDLFSDTDGAAAAAADEVGAALRAAGFEVSEVVSDLGEVFAGFDRDQREFMVARAGRALRLSLCRLDRHHRPVLMDLGPVMHPDDLVATKVAALVNRREVRDYIDVAAAVGRGYDLVGMLALARRHDPGLDDGDVADVGRYLDRLDDARFRFYRLSVEQIRQVRARFAGWPR